MAEFMRSVTGVGYCSQGGRPFLYDGGPDCREEPLTPIVGGISASSSRDERSGRLCMGGYAGKKRHGGSMDGIRKEAKDNRPLCLCILTPL